MDSLRNGKDRTILDNVRHVAQEHIAPRAQATEGVDYIASENLADLCRHGLMGLAVREEYGGLDCGFQGNILVGTLAVEELACACGETSQWFFRHNAALAAVYLLGTPAQQLRFSRAILDACAQLTVQSGELGGSFSNLPTIAQRISGGYLLNGVLRCPTGAVGSTWRLSVAQIEGMVGENNAIVALIHRNNPGVRIYPKQNRQQQYRRPSSTIVYTNCFVPDDDVLGKSGALNGLVHWRPYVDLGWAALYTGFARGAFKAGRKQVRAVTYARGERPIEREVPNRWHIAEMSARIETARHFLATAAIALEEARLWPFTIVEAAKAAYHAKIFAAETALAVTSRLLPITKISTTSCGRSPEEYWRDAWSFVLQESTGTE